MRTLSSREKKYKFMKKQELRIFININTPIVFPQEAIHLDALLTEIVARELFGHKPDRWQNVDKQTELPLPLEKTRGKHPVWRASIGFSSPLTREYQDFWVKRTNDEFAGYVTNNIVWPAGVISNKASKSLAKEVRLEKATGPANDPASGGFKSYYEYRNLLLTDYLLFHAYGNKEEVKRLLDKLSGIGKKTAIGFGKIGKIEVIEIDEDYSLFTPSNKPARNLPSIDYPNLKARIIASPTSSPYWSKRNLVVCYAPTSTIPEWEWDIGNKQASFEDSWFDDEWYE